MSGQLGGDKLRKMFLICFILKDNRRIFFTCIDEHVVKMVPLWTHTKSTLPAKNSDFVLFGPSKNLS